MSHRFPLGLFEGFGIELEYMIVDARTLDVRPISDRLLGPSGDVERGPVTWSNELALHVFEIKVAEPAASLAGLGNLFQAEVETVNRLLAPQGARLLATGMHPWMDPAREFRRWPHENDSVYAAFDRVFDCRGHGWANVQSVHLNLPFADDAEFGRLHAAIRLVLPLLPALAASSPFRDGTASGLLDTRLEVYRRNADRIPSVAGQVIPERIFTRAAYEGDLLAGIYRDLLPHDPEKILRHEWVNARGAIARFDRGSIEIRVLDVQECPRADLAVAGATTAVLRALVEERVSPFDEQERWSESELAPILLAVIREADLARIEDAAYLRTLGYPGRSATAGEVWAHLLESTVSREPAFTEWRDVFDLFLRRGCLARRIRRAAGENPSRERLRAVYADLGACLAEGRLFDPEGRAPRELPT